jgi:hypothetical protein
MPHPTVAAVVRHPETEAFVALNPAVDYAADDVLVKAFPWAFAKGNEPRVAPESVSIEVASAAPGEKRSRRS